MMHLLPRILAIAAALAGCRQQHPPQDNAVEEPVANLPMVPRPDPPLDRIALLAAVREAASAAAAGGATPDGVRSLDGRQFEMRIRFGCRGPAPELKDEWLGWSYEPQKRTLRIRARPTITKDDPFAASIAGEAFEAVEGFWIPRPWLLQPVCPATVAVQSADEQPEPSEAPADEPQPAVEPLPAGPRVGIAQFFTSDDPRTGRRQMRAYENVQTLDEGKPLSSQGFNLVLSGRLRALPGRGVIECVARDSERAPDCLISAEFQRVWIEQPENREVLAEWGSG